MPPLSIEQDKALAALNKLQTSTDDPNIIYSTFPGIEHPCYPPDTIFEISQSQLHAAIQEIVGKENRRLNSAALNKLTKDASMALEKYTVHQCERNLDSDAEMGRKSGKWILPNILDRRDVILQW